MSKSEAHSSSRHVGGGGSRKSTHKVAYTEAGRALLHSHLASSSFKPKKYANDLFTKFTTEEVLKQQQQLQENKDTAAIELRSNVLRNYSEFISASLEIRKLEEDMLELRTLLPAFNGLLRKQQKGGGSRGTPRLHAHDGGSRSNEADPTPLFKFGAEELAVLHGLLDACDDLEALIAERRFVEAVQLITTTRNKVAQENAIWFASNNSNNQTLRQIFRRLQNNATSLAALLINELRNPALKKDETGLVIKLLLQLGLTQQTQEAYLQSKRMYIHNEARKLKFEGDIFKYTEELARLVFTSIETTCKDFQVFFPDSTTKSGKVLSKNLFVQLFSYFFFNTRLLFLFNFPTQQPKQTAIIIWCTEEMKAFTALLRVHVFERVAAYDNDAFSALSRSVQMVLLHTRMLEEQGLFLGPVLEQLIHHDLERSIQSYSSRFQHLIQKQLEADDWTTQRTLTTRHSHRKGLSWHLLFFFLFSLFAFFLFCCFCWIYNNIVRLFIDAKKITSSGLFMYSLLRRFVDDVSPIASMQVDNFHYRCSLISLPFSSLSLSLSLSLALSLSFSLSISISNDLICLPKNNIILDSSMFVTSTARNVSDVLIWIDNGARAWSCEEAKTGHGN
ncbi:hypothetical protein QOT17_009282 [Balamuthia mandrillaris]